MARRLATGVILGLAGLLPLAGCTSLPNGSSTASLIPPLTPSEGKQLPPEELPPEKAAEARLATAQVMEQHGHDVQAIYEYELARQANPRSTGVSRRLAVLYDRQGNFERAQAEYKAALEQQPRDPDLLNDFGYCHYEQGLWIDAERWFRQALEVTPQHARARVNLGMALGMQARYQESLDTFAQAVSPAEAYVNLGFVYTTHGKREEAKQAYRKALELQPGLALAEGALAKLEEAPAETSKKTLAQALPLPHEVKERASQESVRNAPPQPLPETIRELTPPAPFKEPRKPLPEQGSTESGDRTAAIARLEGFVKEREGQIKRTPYQPPVEIATSKDGEYSVDSASPGLRPQGLPEARTVKLSRPIVLGKPGGALSQKPNTASPGP